VALHGLGERTLAVVVYGLSALVCLLVLLLIVSPRTLVFEGLDVSRLPAFHAALNGGCALLLSAGYLFRAHRTAMALAFSLSCVFLISYLIYHSQAASASFGGEGWERPVYFFTLISHIVLAPVVLPLALFAVARALRGEIAKHRKTSCRASGTLGKEGRAHRRRPWSCQPSVEELVSRQPGERGDHLELR
jgi:putative membrane protein